MREDATAGNRPAKRLMVAMLRPDVLHLPAPVPVPGFAVRAHRPGDHRNWARIEHLAGEFASEAAAAAYFLQEFGSHPAFLQSRCFFVESAAGEAVGTAMAMRGVLDGREVGRLGWVGVVPGHQGRGLGRHLVAYAMQRLGEEHEQIYLTTQTTSARAVGMYLALGFSPHPHGRDDAEAWSILSASLGRDIRPPSSRP